MPRNAMRARHAPWTAGVQGGWQPWKCSRLLEEGVLGGVGHATADEDGDDEAVDGNDTSHDDRDDGLHDDCGLSNGGARLWWW